MVRGKSAVFELGIERGWARRPRPWRSHGRDQDRLCGAQGASGVRIESFRWMGANMLSLVRSGAKLTLWHVRMAKASAPDVPCVRLRRENASLGGI